MCLYVCAFAAGCAWCLVPGAASTGPCESCELAELSLVRKLPALCIRRHHPQSKLGYACSLARHAHATILCCSLTGLRYLRAPRPAARARDKLNMAAAAVVRDNISLRPRCGRCCCAILIIIIRFSLQVLDLREGHLFYTLRGHQGPAQAVQFSPNGVSSTRVLRGFFFCCCFLQVDY